MINKKITIAIDGYSSCGKSTLAKALANKLNYIFIDSGAMYRGIALFCIQNNLVQNELILEEKLIKSLPYQLQTQELLKAPLQMQLLLPKSSRKLEVCCCLVG